MLGNFFKNYGKQKIMDAGEGAMNLIVKMDAEGATEASILQLNEYVNDLITQAAEARQEYNKEKAEYDHIQELFDKRMQAAENLQNMIASEEDDTRKQELEGKLADLLDKLESMSPDIEKEKEDAEQAKVILDDLEEMAKEASIELKTARQRASEAKRNMQKALLDEKRAKKNQERAEVAAGLKRKIGGMGSALDTMEKMADDSKKKTMAAKMKTDLLKPIPNIDDDPDIKLAMGESSNSNEGSSISDRLKNLRSSTK